MNLATPWNKKPIVSTAPGPEASWLPVYWYPPSVPALVPIPELAKETLAAPISHARQPVVVNSFGRSGSTALYDGLAASASRVKSVALRERVIKATAWNLGTDSMRRGRIYKTHDYPNAAVPSEARVLYVFGDPIAATASVISRAERDGQGWLDLHAQHLGVQEFPASELYRRDALHVYEHLRAWQEQKHTTVAFVRYERMWDLQDQLTSFVGFPVSLPERRERTSLRIDREDELRATYERLSALVTRLPDWEISVSGSPPPASIH